MQAKGQEASEFKCRCGIYIRQRYNLETLIFLTGSYLCILIYFVVTASVFTIKTQTGLTSFIVI